VNVLKQPDPCKPFETSTDEDLVLAIGRGRMPALGELVRRHQQRALHLAYRSLGDWQLAEDVVQEGFLRVHRAARNYRPESKFSTWFYRIVVNLCMDQLRRRQRQTALAGTIQFPAARNGDTPSHRQEVRELQQAVQEAIGRLHERERMAVILHRFEGLPHVQIAEVMGSSAAAVESLLVRAYRKLRRELVLLDDSIQK
jgi:RNA polymerase sigma-70 factor (ECF subfamily)